jgi:hypothetical protein
MICDKSPARASPFAPSCTSALLVQVALAAAATAARAEKRLKGLLHAAKLAEASKLASVVRRQTEPTPRLPKAFIAETRRLSEPTSKSLDFMALLRQRVERDVLTYAPHVPLPRTDPAVPPPPAMCALAIFDQGLLAEQVEKLCAEGCSGCDAWAGVRHTGSTPKGIGALIGATDFACRGTTRRGPQGGLARRAATTQAQQKRSY